MFWTKNKGWHWDSPAYSAEDGGAGGGAPADTGATAEAAPADPAATLYPDDQPAGAEPAISDAPTVAENETDGNDDDKPTLDPDKADEAGEWKPYEDDPNKTPEENAAAKLENDLKHPINQVPEDGKYQLTMPEGMEVDQPLLDALGPVMSELKLSNGHAQMLVDKYIEAQTADAEKRQQEWAQTIQDWGKQAKEDPEIGGAKWDATAASALSVVKRFGTPELTQYLEASGAGNHPEVIRLMAKVGAMIGEDTPAISDNPGAKADEDPASRLYPNDKPKG